MLQGKIIDLTNFKNDVLSGAIEESRIDLLILKTQDMEEGILVSPNSSQVKSGLNGNTAYTTTSRQGKTVTVCPYLMSSDTETHYN